MEKYLLKIFKLANELNDKQENVFAQINYIANNNKTLELTIRSKKDFSFVERCEVKLHNNPLIKWDNIADLFENYIKETNYMNVKSFYEKN